MLIDFYLFISVGLKLVARLGMVQAGHIRTGTTKTHCFRLARNFLLNYDIAYF